MYATADESRSPHGERGLKLLPIGDMHKTSGRSPHGERGLKLLKPVQRQCIDLVALLTESVD